MGAETVFFDGDYKLEGMLEWSENLPVRGGIVLAHPHPLYGGTMNQPVVFRIAQVCRELGLATLRLNFRGVGRSQGTYDGWQENRDVQAAAYYLAEWLANHGKDKQENLPLFLCGYSFGSVMVCGATGALRRKNDFGDPLPIAGVVLVGLVVKWEYADGLAVDLWQGLRGYSGPALVVLAEHDEFSGVDDVTAALEGLGIRYQLVVIKGADHFYTGRALEVATEVGSFLKNLLKD